MRFLVIKKNVQIGIKWEEIKDASKYVYSITDFKTKKRVKYAQTKKLTVFLPASKNKTKTTYQVIFSAYNAKGKKIEIRTTYFHIEDFVVQPIGFIQLFT